VRFVRAEDGVERVFEPWERALLVDLSGDLAELLRAADSAPDDPALDRLLPDAYPEDRDAAAEFADFARPRLTEGKVASAEAILEDLRSPGPVRISAERIPLWLRALTDLRLVLAERAAERPDRVLVEVSDWLGWVLSDLLDTIEE
jgi:Domain of unknown function (DUF2017)